MANASPPGPFRRYRFLGLLLCLLLLLVGHPLTHGVPGERLVFHVLLTAVILAACLVILTGRRARLLGLAVGLVVLVGNWTGFVVPGAGDARWTPAFHGAAALFLGATVGLILAEIVQEERVTADSVFGAFCGYLLVGLSFAHVYWILDATVPGSFQAPEPVIRLLEDGERRRFLLSYFSFVTLTTVGFGDISPASGPARGVAVIEAVAGQFYIAVLVAELVGKRVGQALVRRGAEARRREVRDDEAQ